ncbi:rano class II histocompatibility antigen, D-1 beta chain [Phycodurus eques]|uniref:rano class II histocompatibility antigen, D-1 beta chain n=1 Tax=Phycodurus eques TaxID=693459 RepID=UPI002ACEFE24|nr:rano class II histocompatibility antigen, D-1 beta chain [Phycodurus eques]
MASFARVVGLLFLTFYVADGFLLHYNDRCMFNSTDLDDIEYTYSHIYNKLELFRFSSALGKFVGYTEFGIKQADHFNMDAAYISSMRATKEHICKPNIEIYYQAALTKSAKPYVRLQWASPPVDSTGAAMLVCVVYNFYPKHVRVTWLRDGREATSGVTYTDKLPDGDWYYQIHSHLAYTPKFGEKITCVVEHVSLEEPLHVDWDPSLPKSEINKLAIGASGLTVGLLLSLGGFLYYRKKSCDAGSILVPTH